MISITHSDQTRTSDKYWPTKRIRLYWTASDADASTPITVALMVVLPDLIPCASPDALMVATFILDELQLTPLVIGFADPFAKFAMAVNCSVLPTVMVAELGDTVSVNVVRVVEPTMPL